MSSGWRRSTGDGMFGKQIPVTERARRLHEQALVLDCHSHFLINATLRNRPFELDGKGPLFFNPLRNAINLPSLQRGKVNALAFTTYIPGRPLLGHDTDRRTDRIIDHFEAIVAASQGQVVKCRTASEIRLAAGAGKLAAFLAIEGGHVLESKLENIEHFHRRGVLMLTLTHFISNGIADGNWSPYRPLGGLSGFGREVIREMERVGMSVDVAHCTDKAFSQVLDTTTRPVICSHGALRRYKKLERNLSDDQVKALAAQRGLFGLIFFPKYLGSSGWDIRAVARQAADVASMVGAEHLCLGSDMDGYTYTPMGFRDASDWPQVTQALIDIGFDDVEIRGILGDNFLKWLEA